jgi:hypothetical protein
MLELPRAFPLWIVVPVTAVVLGLVTELGYRVGRRTRLSPSHEDEGAASDLSTPAVGLLGLMLAFTFGWAATRYDARGNARVDEAKEVANVFRLADFLPDPERARARTLLRNYITVSLSASDAESFRRAFKTREAMHHELWAIGVRAVEANPTSEIAREFVKELDALLNSHLVRSTLAVSARIPPGIVAGLAAILLLTMVMLGYQMGLRSPTRSFALVPLILSVSLVIFLIIDLDRPIEGLLKISNRALVELNAELEAWR